jgi:rfaE bifunctional protein nucleotidyltransferase chain/domain
MSFISTWQNAKDFISNLQQQKGRATEPKIVTTNGCFDIIHSGHCLYLEQARKLGDCLIVGINSDSSVKKLKGPTRPIHNQESRALVLRHLRMVDLVCVFEEETPEAWLEFLRPHIHTKGGDYKVNELLETKVVSRWGGQVVCLPYVEGFSTTQIVERIRK